VVNGFSPRRTIRPRKKTAMAASTAFAYGAIWRWRRRVENSATLAQIDSSVTHRSSEPSWLDHTAVSL
jgi:hypothetical protein